jgi:hypothetical protein
MNPLELLEWVGIIAASLVIASVAALIVWTVIQTMRGKSIKTK